MFVWTTALRATNYDWDVICEYISLYYIHLVVGFILSAVTVYRREMSCNRVFHDEEILVEECDSSGAGETSVMSDDLVYETDELLDGAGMYCSGQAIVHLASQFVENFSCVDDNGQEIEIPSHILQETMTPSELLDRAGNFCAGEPLRAAVTLWLSQRGKEESANHFQSQQTSYDPFTHALPADAHVLIASFLHPKDMLALSVVSKSYRKVVDDSETSHAIWNTLWRRDYAWVVQRWDIGQQALQRSIGTKHFVVDKNFYFSFGETYMGFVLAGRNLTSSCLVGLHGQIYDITSFLDSHPGSPDTLMVHAGKDATRYFEDMIHSLIARRLARKFCVVADLSWEGDDSWGLRPTDQSKVTTDILGSRNALPAIYEHAGESLLLGRKQRTQRGGLHSVRTRLAQELSEVTQRAEARFEKDNRILGDIHPYYDPFQKKWLLWYTSVDLENVFDTVDGD